jgi:hypothetical protein
MERLLVNLECFGSIVVVRFFPIQHVPQPSRKLSEVLDQGLERSTHQSIGGWYSLEKILPVSSESFLLFSLLPPVPWAIAGGGPHNPPLAF